MVAMDKVLFVKKRISRRDHCNLVKNKWIVRFVKRTFDIISSFFAMIILSPVFLIVALAIYIDDPKGSPIFVQDRVGKNGKNFKMYKFRSMVVDAETRLNELKSQNEKDGPVFKMKEDPRITRIGRFIRKTSIDELPQLVNVLKGDMSVVGPRPALPDEVAEYNDFERRRLLMRPGLTCYWQASDNRDDISFDDWMKMDVNYIETYSLWIDIKLIIRTVKVVFTAQGN